jgi:hypothetical protein
MSRWARRTERKGQEAPRGDVHEQSGEVGEFYLERCIARDAEQGAIHLGYHVEAGKPSLVVMLPEELHPRSSWDARISSSGGLLEMEIADAQEPGAGAPAAGPKDVAQGLRVLSAMMKRHMRDPAVIAHLSMPWWKWRWRHLVRRATQWWRRG